MTDESGEPTRVVIDYQQYVEMCKQLNLPLPALTKQERSPMDWYSRTESANSILNGLIALASRESMKESEKPQPDQQRIDELQALRKEVIEAVNNNENFASLERLDEVIEKYRPILEAEKKKIPIRNME